MELAPWEQRPEEAEPERPHAMAMEQVLGAEYHARWWPVLEKLMEETPR